MVKVIVIAVLAVLVVAAVISCLMAAYVAKPRYTSLEKAKQIAEDAGFWRDYDKLEKEELEIESYDGYRLKAFYVPAPQESDKYVIISHGYTYNRYGSLRYLHLFRSFGYNCLIYDNRGHGANPRTKCMMGVRESKDLLQVIDWVHERFGRNIILGLHGESMGSALQIMALKEKPEVQFVVNDCGYADLMGVLTHNVGTLHMPKWSCYFASAACRVVFGYSFTGVRPIDSLKENTVPICFIHGAADDFIPCDHSERMHQAMTAYSELHLFPGAAHGLSIDSDEESYRRIVGAFLEKVLAK
ncbi:MAG: alpha/beta hydrolase [Butyrivibrio sp.]|nr:alpha/beta hydrolase [Acetatifactor muris]MCM1559825.1 alpha/beta hydrolase [Butyrivibrio sp.]